jgi:hypothetical protein
MQVASMVRGQHAPCSSKDVPAGNRDDKRPQREMTAMRKRITIAWRACCLIVTAAVAPCGSPLALESLNTHFSFSFEGHCSAPRQAETRRDADYNISEIVVDEENGRWLERVVMECFALKEDAPTSPRAVFEAFQASEEARCPKKSEWSVALEETHRLLFEQHRGACQDEPPQLLLGLAIHGKEDRWLVTYSAREPIRDPGDRQSFLDSLRDTEVLTMMSPTLGFPVWGPAVGPAWVATLLTDHTWSDGHDVASQLPIPPDWVLARRAYDRRAQLWALAITPPGRTFETADEALMLVNAQGSGRWTSQRHLEVAREDLEKLCKGKATLNVLLQEGDRRVVTETVANGCRKADYEYRLTAHLYGGQSTIFKVEYLARKAPDPGKLREAWAPRMLAIELREVKQ